MSEKENISKTEFLAEVSSKIREQENYLKLLEESIYDTETKYFESTQEVGNIVKGWESFFSVKSKISSMGINKKPKFTQCERIFSNILDLNKNLTLTNTSIPTESAQTQNTGAPLKQKKKFLTSLSFKKRKLNKQDTVINLHELINSKLESEIN
jgi:hypothetical protein